MLLEVGWKQICLILSGVVFLFYLIAEISFSPLHSYDVAIYSLESNNPLTSRMFLTAAFYETSIKEFLGIVSGKMSADWLHPLKAWCVLFCSLQLTKIKAGTQVEFVQYFIEKWYWMYLSIFIESQNGLAGNFKDHPGHPYPAMGKSIFHQIHSIWNLHCQNGVHNYNCEQL